MKRKKKSGNQKPRGNRVAEPSILTGREVYIYNWNELARDMNIDAGQVGLSTGATESDVPDSNK